ncbi:MAG: GTP-binding protein, partial [Candidatus Omnitrophica bacterium]|nr:GTP-binding protein [Candidatus Omnitrophota bacterium]
MKTDLNTTRNIGFIAHIDAGKTTTTERILFYAGKIYKMGEVHDGTTVTDWMSQERERGITITSAATYCKWRNFQINIIDTPGHIDFTVEVERSLKVLDGVVVIFCGVGGVQPQSETVWRQADKYHIPRVAFINKLDRQGSDFFGVVDEMREKLQLPIAPIQIPIYKNDEFKGIIDLIREKAVYYEGESGEKTVEKDIPENLRSDFIKNRDMMLEKIAEIDDLFMGKIVEGKPITPDEIVLTLRKYTIANRIIPVLCGAALKNIGIQRLLDAICDYLPSPLEAGAISGK